MPTTQQLGNIKIKIGEFLNEKGKPSSKTLTIGKLMVTDHSDGTRRIWGKLQLHVLHASLYALVKPYVDKGEAEVSINVFRDEEKPAGAAQGGKSAAAPPAGVDDEIGF